MSFGLIVEGMVAILLATTIGYCIILNQRLKRLHSDRDQLLQMYMGEKFGRDPIWEGHLATEIYAADIDLEAVLHEVQLPLSRVLSLQPGDTVMFDRSPHDPIKLRCGDVELTEAIMGHIGNHVSVRVSRPLNAPKVTMAAFEAIDENKMEGR